MKAQPPSRKRAVKASLTALESGKPPNEKPKLAMLPFIRRTQGDHATMAMKDDQPRIFLFTYQRPGSHPPFLVRFRSERGTRRVTAIAPAGMLGFAIASEEVIKPTIRVLARDGDMVFMELRRCFACARGICNHRR